MIKKIGRCFRNYTSDNCPMHRLEIEKMFYSVLLVIAVGMLLVCTFGIK